MAKTTPEKGALLRALEFPMKDIRHVNAEQYHPARLESPKLDLDIQMSGNELEVSMLQRGVQIQWPLPQTHAGVPEQILDRIRTSQFQFEISRRLTEFFPRSSPSHGLFEGPISHFAILNPGDGQMVADGISGGSNDNVIEAINALLSHKLFFLDAQRYALGKTGSGRSERLNKNASNLPQVLGFLQGERRGTFRKLIAHLREVFSTVGDLSVVTTGGNELEIRVWPKEHVDQSEVSFGLENCGTGVAQVIAILTAMMTSEHAVLIIDEINSFLHPAATKALLRIMQTRYSQHQYIISTRSPDVIAGGNPATVHLVQRDGYESSVTSIDLGKLDHLREIYKDIGVSMTDVFGAERIIFVEGPTEERCFPFIYVEAIGEWPRGIMVTPVVTTGDFFSKTKRKPLIFEIYHRLSKAASPLVETVTFSFDREELSQNQVRDLEKLSGGRLMLLPRRHLECFLIDPSAIAALIAKHVPECAATATPLAVQAYIQTIGGNPIFKASALWNGDISHEKWLAGVDAAALIKNVCGDLTEQRMEFTKTRHSFELLQHVMTNNRSALTVLIDYIRKLFMLAQNGPVER